MHRVACDYILKDDSYLLFLSNNRMTECTVDYTAYCMYNMLDMFKKGCINLAAQKNEMPEIVKRLERERETKAERVKQRGPQDMMLRD